MKSPTQTSFVEPLEARIAPAVIRIGATGPFETPSDTEYHETGPARPDEFGRLNFVDTGMATDAISQSLGTTADNVTFMLKLKAGDSVFRLSESSSYKEFLTVKSGQVIALFTDGGILQPDGTLSLPNNDFDDGELTGLALSANAVVEVNGSVNGDIVTNLSDNGTKDTADDFLVMNGQLSSKQGIKSLGVLGGSVFGNVLSGGSIQSLNVNKNVDNVLAGTAATGVGFDFFKAAGGAGTVLVAPAPGEVGASISNAIFSSVSGKVGAGDGGSSAKGGSLIGIQITSDTDGFELRAGAGGSGNAAARKLNGGNGGDILNVFVSGFKDQTPNSGLQVVSSASELASGDAGLVSGTPSSEKQRINLSTLDGVRPSNGGFSLTFGGDTTVELPPNATAAEVADALNALDSISNTGSVTVVRVPVANNGPKNSFDVTFVVPQPVDAITIAAHAGGAIVMGAGDGGTAEPTGRGGAGGLLKNVNIGFSLVGKTPIRSTDVLADNVILAAGDGGGGKTGGAGGMASLIKVNARTPDVQGSEIELLAGNGGGSISPGGAAGVGGWVRDIELRNQVSSAGGDILVRAGNGGSNSANSKGASGGSVVNASLLGFDLQILAGDGSDGTIGGNGGSVTTFNAIRDDQVVPRNVLINAGRGGVGFATNGGFGGDVRGVLIEDADFQSLFVNLGVAGDGGDGIGGKGGKGGALFGITVTDSDANFGVSATLEGDVALRSGRGGDGGKGGGVGGAMDKVAITGDNLSMTATGGAGGDALTLGAGAAGGTLSSVQLDSVGLVNGKPVAGRLEAGDGGDGIGRGGAGGAGGDVRASSSLKLVGKPGVLPVDFVGNGQILAGDGGSGQNNSVSAKGGAAGRGGSVITSGLFAEQGSGEIIAGNAGVNGGKAGNGGSIIGLNKSASGDQIGLRAATSLKAIAGNGSHGGQGGDIIGQAYGSTALALSPTPTGSILIQAGNGSADGTAAGRGGNLDTLNGSISSGVGMKTELIAGNGGGSPTALKAGAGGLIRDVTISRGGAEGVVFTVKAGDAGDAPLASAGAAGGSVLNVGVTDISSAAIFRSVAAGDGGDGAKKAGPGGSITGVDVQQHDIGVRTGEKFGYATMGGLFAGVAGSGLKSALNGSVSGITANEISSIVAGRVGAPHLAEKVSDIYVAGSDKTLLLVSNHAFVPNGDFKLRFESAETSLLPGGATSAQVQSALNSLPGIVSAGGVTVASDGRFGYDVRFNIPGNRAEISGLEVVGGLVEENTKGSTGTPAVTTPIQGGLILPVTEVRSGQANLTIVETNSGAAVFSTSEQVPGSATDIEVQILDLQGLAATPTGAFRLSFGNVVVPALTLPALPATATASEIQTALNTLPGILAAGGVAVTLAPNETARFVISFNQPGARDTILGTRLLPEVQRLDLGEVPTLPGSSFTLNFAGQTTGPLLQNASAANIKTALDALPAIQALAASNNGSVRVTQLTQSGAAVPGRFDITFVDKSTGAGINGEQVDLTGIALLPETQRVNLGTLASVPGATFTLTNGIERTPALPANASKAQIETALNLLPSIHAAGDVDVSLGANGALNITFRVAGNQPALTGAGLQFERQLIDLNSLAGLTNAEISLALKNNLEVIEFTKGSALNLAVAETRSGVLLSGETGFTVTTTTNGTSNTQETQQISIPGVTGNGAFFTLSFGGQTTAPLLASTLTFLTLQNALNALPVIAGLGGVVVSAGGASTFNIAFSTTGDLPQITGTASIPETQTLNVTPLIGNPGAEFTLTFNGETTAPLPVGATTAAVQTALNLLGSIQAESNVTVTSPTANQYAIRFNATGTPANQLPIIALGGGASRHEHQVIDLGSLTAYKSGFFQLSFNGETTDPLPATATNAEIEGALIRLQSIKEIRSDDSGLVRVTSLGNGRFDVEFNVFGDQAAINALGAVSVDRYPVVVTDVRAGAQLPVLVSETRSGSSVGAEVAELVPGGGAIKEVQRVDLSALSATTIGDFTLGFGVLATLPISASATALQVQTALNALQTIQSAGGVDVVAGPGKSFDITFRGPAQPNLQVDQPSIVASTRVAEVQTIDLGATLPGVAGGEFFLKFGNDSSVPISVGATAAQVEAALDAMPSINAIGGVSVTAAGAGKFAVAFQQLSNVAPLTGFTVPGAGADLLGREVQQIALGELTTVPNGKFTLAFNGETTAVLPGTATAADVQAALNALNSVKDVRTDNTGAVTVTKTSAVGSPAVFEVTFNTFGDRPSISGRGITLGDRPLAISELRAGAAATPVPVVELIPGKTAAPGVPAVREVQTIDLAAIRASTGEFQLRFDNNPGDTTPAGTTSLLPSNATPSDIQIALNAIASITAAGGVSVATGVGDKVDVSFLAFGPQESIVGMGGLHEQQVVALGSLSTEGNALFRLAFNGESARALSVAATAADLETALDALASVRALRPDNSGSVSVTGTALTGFQIDFKDLGNQNPITGVGAVSVQPTLDIREIVNGGTAPLAVTETIAGQGAIVPTVELTPGTLSTVEVQRIDISNVIGLTNGVYQLAFGANKTSYLPRFASVSDIGTALNALPSIISAGGVTVAKGLGNTIDVTFVTNGNKADLLSAKGGVLETQHFDNALFQLAGQSHFVVEFGLDATPILAETASLATVSQALNNLPGVQAVGGVVVTQGVSGYEVKFNEPGNRVPFRGSVSLFESQSIDLQKLPANADGLFQLSFGGQSTGLLKSDANSTQIEVALNSLSTIKSLVPGNSGSVSVAGIAPGKFRVDFNAAGSQQLITGTANTVGSSVRVPVGLPGVPTLEQIEGALESSSFFDLGVGSGPLPGTYLVNFSKLGDQPTIRTSSFIHEQQRVDIYGSGGPNMSRDFTLRFGNDETAPLSADATGLQVRAALNTLPSIIAAGGVREVSLGENSSFTVVFDGDSDVGFLTATQTLKPISVTTKTEGDLPSVRETQNVSFTFKGDFVGGETPAFVGFKKANFVGAIYDFNEIDSNVFHFIEQNGLYTEGNGVPGYNVSPVGDIAVFNEGDMPIDGIIMARTLDQKTINFTPEAKFTATGFFDFNNQL